MGVNSVALRIAELFNIFVAYLNSLSVLFPRPNIVVRCRPVTQIYYIGGLHVQICQVYWHGHRRQGAPAGATTMAGRETGPIVPPATHSFPNPSQFR